jgi:hypothetical protein
VAAILIFTLLVSQFNSIAQPFAILTALPLSIVGAMAGLYITGNNFSIMSFIGLVGLSGIVVNDSIVLVDCINRMRQGGLSMFEAILAGGQQRLRPIISTTVSTVGGILTLTITDELWEGLGVVIIFGICFATVLTLVVVPVMYSLFEGVRYYIISAFRGPRWEEAPAGSTFYFVRGRFKRLGFFLLMLVQVAAMGIGLKFFAPGFIESVSATTLQAPSLLKLGIEAGVFFIALGLEAVGVLLLLLIPTWIGLVFFMAKRSREGYCVDITPQGVSVGTPVDRYFIEKEAITRIKTAPFFPRIPSLCIYAGRRRVVLRKLVSTQRLPEQKKLWAWFRAPTPDRFEIRKGMMDLEVALRNLMDG